MKVHDDDITALCLTADESGILTAGLDRKLCLVPLDWPYSKKGVASHDCTHPPSCLAVQPDHVWCGYGFRHPKHFSRHDLDLNNKASTDLLNHCQPMGVVDLLVPSNKPHSIFSIGPRHLKIYNIDNQKCNLIGELMFDRNINCFYYDGRVSPQIFVGLASNICDACVICVNPENSKIEERYALGYKTGICTSVTLTPDGLHLVAGTSTGWTVIFSINDGIVVYKFQCSKNENVIVTNVFATGDGRVITVLESKCFFVTPIQKQTGGVDISTQKAEPTPRSISNLPCEEPRPSIPADKLEGHLQKGIRISGSRAPKQAQSLEAKPSHVEPLLPNPATSAQPLEAKPSHVEPLLTNPATSLQPLEAKPVHPEPLLPNHAKPVHPEPKKKFFYADIFKRIQNLLSKAEELSVQEEVESAFTSQKKGVEASKKILEDRERALNAYKKCLEARERSLNAYEKSLEARERSVNAYEKSVIIERNSNQR